MDVPKPSAELESLQRSLRETDARLQLLVQLQGLGVALARARTSEEIVDLAVRKGAETIAAAASAFIRRAGNEIETVINAGVSAEDTLRYARFSPTLRVAGVRALETMEPEWVESRATFVAQYPDSPSHADTSASCSLPLVASDHVLGVLSFRFTTPRTFSPSERAFLQAFAGQAAQALERAEAEHRERLAKASLATTIRSIGDAVIATDAAQHITMMNTVASSLTGFTEDEARGRPLREVFVVVDGILRAKDGRESAIDESIAPIREPGGPAEGIVVVFRDVTQKKRDEARRRLLELASGALADSLDYESTLTTVAQLAVPGFADWCAVDVLEEGSTTARRVAVAHVDPAKVAWAVELAKKYPPPPDSPHGVPAVLRSGKSELYASVTEEMLNASTNSEHERQITRELRIRSVVIVPLRVRGRTLGALTFVHTDSDSRYDESDLAFAEDLANRCASAIENARIYDAEQRARNAADAANRAKDEFLAMVSHELRTPLNAILGWAKMLSSGALDAEKRAKAVATIDRNSVAMAQLIEDLLDISRIISGKMRLEVQTVHLERVIEAAIDSIRPAADAKNIELVERIEVDAQTSGDPARLQQVVWNLLSNAVKFTPRGGKIEVELVLERGGVEVAVTDSGHGIAPRFLPHVFEAFRQEDASATRSRGGLGLGLAITRQLVELHGGSVTARSEGEGRGATFRVHLPAVGGAAGAPQRTGRVRKFRLDSLFGQLPQLAGVHVLVVDDEEDARTLLKTVLEELGARVTLAANVEDALAAIAREVPSVLVSDIGMPGQDGYDLIRAVRELPHDRGGNIPATALTAYARAEDRRRTIDAGFTMHVAKPVDPAEIVAVIAELARPLSP